MKPHTYALLLSLVLWLCIQSNSMAQRNSPTYKNIEKALQTKFVMAEEGDLITIEAGHFKFSRSLWLDEGKNITIRGAGMDKTYLSFEGQADGAEGIKVTNGKDIVIEGLTVLDTKGDAIKVQETNGITFRNVRVTWSGKPDKDNGAYGLYPVMCSNVLIENCEASGASDAGIYVGQSKHIIVKNSKAFHNVAGIEIENSLYADVYDNEAYDNTGGILVFDLPNLVQKKGGNVRVFNNNVRENNYTNFAPKGNIVGKVPPGTGIMVLATNNVEIFHNNIINNRTAGTAIISYFMTEEPINDSLYYPYPFNVYIHDNTYERENIKATFEGRMGKLFRLKLKFGKDVPHIIYDGIIDKDVKGGDQAICMRNNKNASFANIDAENDFKNITREIGKYKCSLKALSPAELTKRQ